MYKKRIGTLKEEIAEEGKKDNPNPNKLGQLYAVLHKEESRRGLKSLIIIAMLTATILFASIPPARAQFVLASWDYPDEYGQGIEAFEIAENSTGSWVQVGAARGYADSSTIDWNASLFIRLRCYTWFNSTLTGASTTNDGKNYQRHNIIVTNSSATVFSQVNFTYFYADDSIDPPMWYYGYEVVLNFLPVAGTIYTVTITYEVYYE